MKGFRTEERSRSTISDEEHKDLNKQFKSLWRDTVLRKSELFEIENKLVELHHHMLVQQLPEQRWKDLVDAESPLALGKRVGSINGEHSCEQDRKEPASHNESNNSSEGQAENEDPEKILIVAKPVRQDSRRVYPSQNSNKPSLNKPRDNGLVPSETWSGSRIEYDRNKPQLNEQNPLPSRSLKVSHPIYLDQSITLEGAFNQSEDLNERHQLSKPLGTKNRFALESTKDGQITLMNQRLENGEVGGSNQVVQVMSQARGSVEDNDADLQPPKGQDKTTPRFSKEALRVLKEWFLEHVANPYPT